MKRLFLKLFFQPDKDIFPTLIAAERTDHFSKLILAYDVESRNVGYVSQNFSDITVKRDEELKKPSNVFSKCNTSG